MLATTEISAAFLIRVALAIPLLLVLPGWVVLRLLLRDGAGAGSNADPGLAPWEAAFVRLILSIAVSSWVAILLAELGRLSFDTLLLVVGAASLALGRYLGAAGPQPAAQEKHRLVSALGLSAALLLAAVVFLPPFESVIWASDATVYLNFGHQVAETGTLLYDDPLLEEIPVPSRQELFRNPVPGDVTGLYARFPGGFLIPEVAETRVTAGFAPLLPVLIALAYALLGLGGALYVAPVLAILGVGAIYLVGSRLRGVQAGLLATGLITLSLPQIWFARLGLSEVVAELFVFAGLLALLIARESPRFAAAGGALFGMAIFAKFDLIVVLPLAVAGFLVIALWSGPRAQRLRIAHFAIVFSLLLLHNVVHFLVFPSHYRPFIWSKIDSLIRPFGISTAEWPALAVPLVVISVVAAVAALAGFAWWALRENHKASRSGAYVLLALMVTYCVTYLGTSTSHLRETIVWLGWYLSWTIVVLFFLAALLELRREWCESEASSLFVLVLLAAAGLHYLYDPHEPTVHIWSMRRLVPIVLPAMLLILSIAVAELWKLTSRRGWRWTTPATAVLLVGLVAQPSLAIIGEPMWEGAIDKTAEVANLFPTGSVVLVGSDLSGTHLATTLNYAYDTHAILLREDYLHPSFVEDVVIEWLSAGRGVFLLLGDETGHLVAPRLSLSWLRDLDLELHMLETTTSRIPNTVLDHLLRLSLYQVAESHGKSSVDIGTVAEDFLFGLRGFYAAEQSPGPESSTFRWTGAVASIELPSTGDEIRLVVDGGRSEGSTVATISIRVDQRVVVEKLVVPNLPTTITVQIPGEHRGSLTKLTIESNVFSPRNLGLSADERELGVKVYSVEF